MLKGLTAHAGENLSHGAALPVVGGRIMGGKEVFETNRHRNLTWGEGRDSGLGP